MSVKITCCDCGQNGFVLSNIIFRWILFNTSSLFHLLVVAGHYLGWIQTLPQTFFCHLDCCSSAFKFHKRCALHRKQKDWALLLILPSVWHRHLALWKCFYFKQLGENNLPNFEVVFYCIKERERETVKSHFIFKLNCKVVISSSEQGFCLALCLRVSSGTRYTIHPLPSLRSIDKRNSFLCNFVTIYVWGEDVNMEILRAGNDYELYHCNLWSFI